jgi:hypothetical protein
MTSRVRQRVRTNRMLYQRRTYLRGLAISLDVSRVVENATLVSVLSPARRHG